MEIRPLKRYTGAGLPTRDVLDRDSELLRRMPLRWQGSAAVVAALTTVGVAGACLRAAAAPARVPTAATVSHVAPLFPPGAGMGMRGDMPPPAYMTEDAARQVIADEAKKAGIEFAPDQASVNIGLQTAKTDEGGDRAAVTTVEMVLDGTDAKRGISYEFVSDADRAAWVAETKNNATCGWDPEATADLVQKELVRIRPEGTTVVFYDPGYGKQFEAEAQEQLRKQVREFITWAKAEGVI